MLVYFMFGFKKKVEVVDLRPKDSDMPIPSKIRERLMASGKTQTVGGNSFSDALESNSSTSISPSSSANQSSSGGFFSFFGGSDSSSSSASSSDSSVKPPTSFWDANNSTSSVNSSSSPTSSSSERIETQVNDLLYRFSRLIDRVELVEKKLERLERKNN